MGRSSMFSWFSLRVGRSTLTSKHITVQCYYVRAPLHLLIHTPTHYPPEAADTIPDWIMPQRTKIFQLQQFYDKKIIAVWGWKHFSIINSTWLGSTWEVALSSQNYMEISETSTASKSLTLPVSRGRMAMNVNLDWWMESGECKLCSIVKDSPDEQGRLQCIFAHIRSWTVELQAKIS